MIIHVMTPKSRSYYDLDGFWAEGEVVDLSAVIKPNVVDVDVEPPAEELVSCLFFFFYNVEPKMMFRNSIQFVVRWVVRGCGGGLSALMGEEGRRAMSG